MPTKHVIYIDVDDTLIRSFGSKRIPIPSTIAYAREASAAGNPVYCWSRVGADYAREVATQLGIAECFAGFLPKPDIIIDDQLDGFLSHCEFILPLNAGGPVSSERVSRPAD